MGFGDFNFRWVFDNLDFRAGFDCGGTRTVLPFRDFRAVFDNFILERVLTVGVPGQFCRSEIFRLIPSQNDLIFITIFPNYKIVQGDSVTAQSCRAIP